LEIIQDYTTMHGQPIIITRYVTRKTAPLIPESKIIFCWSKLA